MKFEKKDFIYIGIISAVLFLGLSGTVGYQNAFTGSEKELTNAETKNNELGEYLTESLDRTAELEYQNNQLRKTTSGIREHNNNALRFFNESLSETAGINELVDIIEKGIIEIEKAIYFPDNY